MRKIYVFLVLIMLIFTACSKTEEKKQNSLETGAENENTDTESMEKSKDSSKKGESSNPWSDYFSKIPKLPEYKVTYEVKDSDGSVEKQTIVVKNKDFRIDSGKTSTYYVNGKAYMCMEEEENEPVCYEFDQFANDVAKNDLDFRDNWQNYKITELPSKQIAGTSARCFSYSEAEITYELCYSKEYVPLYTKVGSTDGYVELKATEYSVSVSDSEFKLPAEPQRFGFGDME